MDLNLHAHPDATMRFVTVSMRQALLPVHTQPRLDRPAAEWAMLRCVLSTPGQGHHARRAHTEVPTGHESNAAHLLLAHNAESLVGATLQSLRRENGASRGATELQSGGSYGFGSVGVFLMMSSATKQTSTCTNFPETYFFFEIRALFRTSFRNQYMV